jgi:hypothetical protein
LSVASSKPTIKPGKPAPTTGPKNWRRSSSDFTERRPLAQHRVHTPALWDGEAAMADGRAAASEAASVSGTCLLAPFRTKFPSGIVMPSDRKRRVARS